MANDAKPQLYTFDLGHLCCNDTNPLPAYTSATKEAVLTSTAKDCAQALIHQLLTACPIARSSDGDLQIKLPEPSTLLPREKSVPSGKEKTRWEKFAAKKGIKPTKKEGKLVYDEAKGEWVPKYGYKGKKMDDGDWLVEVDEKQEDKRKAGEGEGGKSKKPKKGK